MKLALALLVWIGTPQAPAQEPERTLAEFERIALDRNPTLAMAEAATGEARGVARQAGAWPNPVVGVEAEELSRRASSRGKWGLFAEQEIPLGKPGLSRRVAEHDIRRSEIRQQAQRERVLNSVRIAFYDALAAQRLVDVRTRLHSLIREAVAITRQLRNVGQADTPDLIEAELEEQRALLAVDEARRILAARWAALTAIAGDSSIPAARLAGDIESIPDLQLNAVEASILDQSPGIREAAERVAQAEALLMRARAERRPDLLLRGGVLYDREHITGTNDVVGPEAFVEAGIRVPLFDRKTGGIDAASSRIRIEQAGVERIRLDLRARVRTTFERYASLRERATRYRTTMLPRATEALTMYRAAYQQMAAAYPQVLIAQRTLLQLEDEYNEALAEAWHHVVLLQGMLLEGGLEEP